jgi:hypothetical protein
VDAQHWTKLPPPRERVFLHERGVLVTDRRLANEEEVFAMGGITSVGVKADKAFARLSAEIGGAAGATLGFLAWLATGWLSAGFLAAVAVAGATALFTLAAGRKAVVVTTAGGERAAVTHPDRAFLERVAGAVNDAIVSRGG